MGDHPAEVRLRARAGEGRCTMSATVGEIMNTELFSVGPQDTVQTTLAGILGLEITAAPVLDAERHPLGVVSLRDLLGREGLTASERMTAPAVVVREQARIVDAARLIGETGFRHLVVVDERGLAIGMVSAIDIVRALVGLPARHPAPFPHFDTKTGLIWTDDTPFDAAHLEAAPDGAGLLALVHDAPDRPRRVVWVESAANVSRRLRDMMSLPQESPELARWLADRSHLRFRAAAVSDAALRERLERALRNE
jgi:CBS domain-containing protein